MLVLGLGDAKGRARWSWRTALGNINSRGSSEQPRLPGEEAVGRNFIGLGVGTGCLALPMEYETLCLLDTRTTAVCFCYVDGVVMSAASIQGASYDALCERAVTTHCP